MIDLIGKAGMSDELKAYYHKMMLARLAPAIEKNPIDCRSEEGITIGLIDAIISISRVLNDRLVRFIGTDGINDALADLESDADLENIMAHARLVKRLED